MTEQKTLLIVTSLLFLTPPTIADELETITVEGHYEAQIGEAISASEGIIGQVELAARPIARTGEVLETVPGMVVTQHSGTGKANQYFLRGFNLDHGTDFRTSVDGMPINMRTHGHGQGYTDLNFIIPELIERIDYKKGPFYAEVGDFSGAGAAEFAMASQLEERLLHVSLGENRYQRFVATNDLKVQNGNWIMGLEHNRYDGPWADIDEDLDKTNVFLRRSWNFDDRHYSLTLMGYDNQWNSADQIPTRAVESDLINRLGSLDTGVGGESNRYSISGHMHNDDWNITAYAIDYDMTLWSNFTYFLDDPANGDQFQQVDSRRIYGVDTSYQLDNRQDFGGLQQTLGLQWRTDDIDEVGLYRTQNRERLSSVRSDEVTESSVGLYWQGASQWNDQLRSTVGLRYDFYDFDVDSDRNENSGSGSDGIASAKFNLAYTLDDHWEVFGGIGQGFHSNDARGVTIKVDPVTGEAVDNVDPLVRSFGAEIGLRFFETDKLNASIALWGLELDSELLFVGDAGNTEASRASRRYGVELTTYYRPFPGLTLDGELSWTRTRFTEDKAGEGDHVEGSLPVVVSLGAAYENDQGWFSSARLRHFGERSLDSFDNVQSDATTTVNLRVGKTIKTVDIGLDIINLFDSEDHDIDYLYASRLNGEIADGVEDIHYHPLEPRTARFYLTYHY